jgi:hypothetical protein
MRIFNASNCEIMAEQPLANKALDAFTKWGLSITLTGLSLTAIYLTWRFKDTVIESKKTKGKTIPVPLHIPVGPTSHITLQPLPPPRPSVGSILTNHVTIITCEPAASSTTLPLRSASPFPPFEPGNDSKLKQEDHKSFLLQFDQILLSLHQQIPTS